LGGAGALPNKPLIYMKNMNEIFVQNIVKWDLIVKIILSEI
jgi:hypothetical protein